MKFTSTSTSASTSRMRLPSSSLLYSTSESYLHSSSSSSSPPSRPIIEEINIPDLRFENSYLEGIKKFVRTERIDDGSSEGRLEVVKVDWRGVVWETFRVQVFRQFVSGLVWGTATVIIAEVFSYMRPRVSSFLGIRRPPPPKSGGFTSRMRDFAKSLAGGVEANIALAE